MSWKELRKRGNKLYHLAHYSNKARVRKKNLRRVREFEEKYHIPVGPIPEFAKGGKWNNGAYAGGFMATAGYPASLYGVGARIFGIV